VSGSEPARLILASASPRRRELLLAHGYRFEVVPSAIDESSAATDAAPPHVLVERLSAAKARDVAGRLKDGVVLAGDTVAALGDRVIGKPADREDARAILRALAGTRHEVITGIALVHVASGQFRVAHDRTAVYLRTLSDAEIEDYLNTNEWRGKAGAYGIQDVGDQFVSRIEGSFTNVVGFPMELVVSLLEEWNVQPA
jgi:septum formation protein